MNYLPSAAMALEHWRIPEKLFRHAGQGLLDRLLHKPGRSMVDHFETRIMAHLPTFNLAVS
jgi:hypothetical protein